MEVVNVCSGSLWLEMKAILSLINSQRLMLVVVCPLNQGLVIGMLISVSCFHSILFLLSQSVLCGGILVNLGLNSE